MVGELGNVPCTGVLRACKTTFGTTYKGFRLKALVRSARRPENIKFVVRTSRWTSVEGGVSAQLWEMLACDIKGCTGDVPFAIFSTKPGFVKPSFPLLS